MANIKDVAERAGVSSTTVSHVLNNTRFVDPVTKSRVVAAMEELGYRPNALARSLRRQESLTIGVVVHDIANPFFSFLIKAIEGVARQAGYSVILASSDENPERLTGMIEVLLAKRVDGLIVAPVSSADSTLLGVERHGTPIVYLGQRPVGAKGPMVYERGTEVAASAVQHLIDDGHRRIGIIAGNPKIPTLIDRMGAYRRVLEQHGIPSEDSLIRTDNIGFDDAADSMRALLRLSDPPTAVFCTNFLMTTGALSVLHEERVPCPGQIAIVGFDDHVWTGLFQPPLTMVRMQTEAAGIVAAQMLLDCMRGKTIENPDVWLSAELVVRGSCSERCLSRHLSGGEACSFGTRVTSSRSESLVAEEVVKRT